MQLIPLINGAPGHQPSPGWVNSYCDGSHYHYYYPGDSIPSGHLPPQPTPGVDPDWLTFRLSALSDPAYLRVVMSANPVLLSRFENELRAENTYLPVLATMWSQVLATTPEANRPTVDDYRRWTELATSCGVGFTFSSEGLINPTGPVLD